MVLITPETLFPPLTRFCTSARVAASSSPRMARSKAGEVWESAGADIADRLRAIGTAQAVTKRVKGIGFPPMRGKGTCTERKVLPPAVPNPLYPGRLHRLSGVIPMVRRRYPE